MYLNEFFQTPQYTARSAEKGGYYKPLSWKQMETFFREDVDRAGVALKRDDVGAQ